MNPSLFSLSETTYLYLLSSLLQSYAAVIGVSAVFIVLRYQNLSQTLKSRHNLLSLTLLNTPNITMSPDQISMLQEGAVQIETDSMLAWAARMSDLFARAPHLIPKEFVHGFELSRQAFTTTADQLHCFARTAFKMICLPSILTAIFASLLFLTDFMGRLDLLTLAGSVALMIAFVGLVPVVIWTHDSFVTRRTNETRTEQTLSRSRDASEKEQSDGNHR